LISNASGLGRMVGAQLEALGMPLVAYDAVITSGDVTRDYFAARPCCAVFGVGPGDSGLILEGLSVSVATMHDADLGSSDHKSRPKITCFERGSA
jgi:ribonucleotide monophosphatase NagD (HAD superfamily)